MLLMLMLVLAWRWCEPKWSDAIMSAAHIQRIARHSRRARASDGAVERAELTNGRLASMVALTD
jgi:hypothetical protein